jgi:hypothetical protein
MAEQQGSGCTGVGGLFPDSGFKTSCPQTQMCGVVFYGLNVFYKTEQEKSAEYPPQVYISSPQTATNLWTYAHASWETELSPRAYSISQLASHMLMHAAYSSDVLQPPETNGKEKKTKQTSMYVWLQWYIKLRS